MTQTTQAHALAPDADILCVPDARLQSAPLAKEGIRLFLQNRLPESLAALQSALVLTPKDIPLLNNLAVVQDRSGQPTEAIDTLGQSLALNPAQPETLLHLGNLHRLQNNLSAALATYQAALALQPNLSLAWQSLALVHQSLRQPREAIRCLLTSQEHSAPAAPILSILGQLFYETGQIEKSHAAYSIARDLDPANPLYHQMLRETRFALSALQTLRLDAALQTYQDSRTARPAPQDKDTSELLQTTFAFLRAHGHAAQAHALAAFRAALYPHSPTAAYLLQASSGDQSLARSPDAYLIESFNAFADRFDHHLTQTLQYDIPRQLAAALRGAGVAPVVSHTLDAGCGTGLCAPHLRPLTATLTGVDLAPNMLTRARATGLYDHLHCAELTAFLLAHPQTFDLICAADVLIYFGPLTPLAAAFATALKPQGLLAFSTESPPPALPPSHHLLTSGRFAHDPMYLQETFAPHFIPLLTQPATIRLEATLPVPGHLSIFRRK